MSVRTLYSYLNDGVLTARNVDLKRKVKFKPRKVHKTQIKDRTVFQGRMFTDFQKLKLDHFAEWIPSIRHRNPNASFSLSF